MKRIRKKFLRTSDHAGRRRSRRLHVEQLEDRRLLAYGATVLGDGSLEVTLDDALDQFGFQPTLFQAYDSTPANGYDDALGAFSIFDTGASVVTIGASDQFLFSFLGEGSGQTGIPIQVPCGAVAEGVGGLSLIGHISEPGTVVADGLHVSTLSFDDDGFPVFELGIHNPPLGTVADPLANDDALLGDSQLSDVDGLYNGNFLVFVTGSLRGQVREISSYTGATRRMQFSAAFPSEPAAGDQFMLVAPEAPFLVETVAAMVEDSTPGEQLFTASPGLVAQDNLYEGQYLQFTSGPLTGQIRRIVEYVGASRAIYLSDPLPAVPSTGDQFRILQINTTPAAVVDGIQAFLGAYEGAPPEGCPAPASASLPTIAGTPMLRPSSSHPQGLAANIRPSGAVMDFSEFFGVEGFVIPVPDVRFQEPGLGIPDDPMCLVTEGATTRNICTAPVRLPLQFVGAEVEQPGQLSEGYNVVQPHVTVSHGGLELTDQRFLFDTGAQLSLISEAQAEFFGLDLLAPEDTISVQGAGGVINDLPGYRIESLSMPLDGGQTLTFHNVWVYVLDAAPGILDGIMGMNLFNSAAAMLYEPNHAEGPYVDLSFFTEQLYSLPFADVEEIEPNSVREEANPIQPGQYGFGSIGTNDVDFWGTPGGSVGDLVFAYVDTQNATGTPQSQIQLIANSGVVLAEDAGDGPGGGAVVAGVEIPTGQAGNVYYRVAAEGGEELSRYELYTAIVDPLDIADEGELVSGTNDTAATAVPATRTVMTGQVPAGDVDYYSFVATEGTRIVVMADNDPDRDGLLTPTQLTLFGPTGEIFAPTSSGGDANAAGAVAQVSESGTYYVRVDRAAGGADDDYRLLVQVYGGGSDLLAAELIQAAEVRRADAEAAVDAAGQQLDDAWAAYYACGGDPNCELDALIDGVLPAESAYIDANLVLLEIEPQTQQVQAFAGSIGTLTLPSFDAYSLPPTVENFEVTPTGFIATFASPMDTDPLNLLDDAGGTWGPADVELVGDVVGPVSGSLVVENRRIRFLASGGALAPDRYTVTLRSG
ncbi:MAG: aspartyl protease family protein, partial [Planctomycetes bacterium]|nr:aspartyl protease family protein [Planctomycetota bacterium]